MSHNELLLQPYGAGVKLVRPDVSNYQLTSVTKLLNLPFNVFFLDLDHQLKNANETYVDSFGCDSLKSALNKTAWDIATRECAEHIIATNLAVTSLQKSKIFEININLKNKINFMSLAMKFPLYDELNKIVGLFGFSSVVGKHSLGDFVTKISELGFLTVNDNEYQSKNEIDNVRLSQRQMEVLRLVVRGKHSKEIAKEIGLSYRTVQHYIDNIKDKLNVYSRSELIDKVIDYL